MAPYNQQHDQNQGQHAPSPTSSTPGSQLNEQDDYDPYAYGQITGFAWPEKAGFIAIVASFVIHIESSSTINGRVVEYSSPSSTIGGIIAIICGGIALALLKKTASHAKAKRGIAAVLLLGLGGYQVAAGQGTFAKQARLEKVSPELMYCYKDTRSIVKNTEWPRVNKKRRM